MLAKTIKTANITSISCGHVYDKEWIIARSAQYSIIIELNNDGGKACYYKLLNEDLTLGDIEDEGYKYIRASVNVELSTVILHNSLTMCS